MDISLLPRKQLRWQKLRKLIWSRKDKQGRGNVMININIQDNHINIGIIGTGRIAARFLEESSYVSGINVSAIYNPHLESVLWFAKNNKIDIDGPMILTDDIEVFFDSVDAVYIATPHETHTEYISTALRREKHVLCENQLD